jgi:hypothetical protein
LENLSLQLTASTAAMPEPMMCSSTDCAAACGGKGGEACGQAQQGMKAHHGRVVDDGEVRQVAPQPGQVLQQQLHARLLRVRHAQAGGAVEAVREDAPLRVQQVQQRLCIALRACKRTSGAKLGSDPRPDGGCGQA